MREAPENMYITQYSSQRVLFGRGVNNTSDDTLNWVLLEWKPRSASRVLCVLTAALTLSMAAASHGERLEIASHAFSAVDISSVKPPWENKHKKKGEKGSGTEPHLNRRRHPVTMNIIT